MYPPQAKAFKEAFSTSSQLRATLLHYNMNDYTSRHMRRASVVSHFGDVATSCKDTDQHAGHVQVIVTITEISDHSSRTDDLLSIRP